MSSTSSTWVQGVQIPWVFLSPVEQKQVQDHAIWGFSQSQVSSKIFHNVISNLAIVCHSERLACRQWSAHGFKVFDWETRWIYCDFVSFFFGILLDSRFCLDFGWIYRELVGFSFGLWLGSMRFSRFFLRPLLVSNGIICFNYWEWDDLPAKMVISLGNMWIEREYIGDISINNADLARKGVIYDVWIERLI